MSTVATESGNTRSNDVAVTWETATDAELLRSPDPQAFAELIARNQTVVFGAAFRILRDRSGAEDIAQDAFLRAFRSRSTFSGAGSARGWLYTIAKNLALNSLTRQRETPHTIAIEATGGLRPDEEFRRRSDIDDVRAAISDLPEPMRQPLILREYEDMPYAVIAEVLDLPINTVRTRIHRARRALEEHLSHKDHR